MINKQWDISTEYNNQFRQETAGHMDLPLLSERPANQALAQKKSPEIMKMFTKYAWKKHLSKKSF